MENEQLFKSEIEAIKARNQKVELDKAWETSLTRKILVAALTYLVIVIFFIVSGLSRPFVSAIVPTIGFLLSTLTVNYSKRLWITKNYQVPKLNENFDSDKKNHNRS